MKHFLVEITYLVGPELIAEVVGEHRAFLQTGYERGWLLMSGPRIPRTGGVIIARAPSLDELKAFFAQDPYQLKKMASYQYSEFDPVKRQAFLENWVSGEPGSL
jgi:uncharacterized protein YciI